MSNLIRISLLAVAALCLVPATAQAQEDDATVAAAAAGSACDRPESLSTLQRRIVEKASEGAMPLIRFVHRTRMIHQLDVYETVAWLEQRRAARKACAVAVADATSVQ